MSDASARFDLPWLQPGQAQKEMFHNEALAIVDAALHPAVEAVGATVPPANPAEGQCWIVGAAPAGEWTGRAGMLAAWTAGGWRFVAMPVGTTVWSVPEGLPARRTTAGWALGVLTASRVEIGGEVVLGARRPAIPEPTGGNVVDTNARAAIHAMLQALRDHGLIAT